MKKSLSLLAIVSFASGCATVPNEAPITAKVTAPIASVQFQLEDIIREDAPQSQVTDQTTTMMTVTNNCISLAQMDAFKCSLVMMSIGNSGWSGPFHIQNYRFTEINGQTNVRGNWSWCATNAFGKQNCSQINPAASNRILKKLEAALAAPVQPVKESPDQAVSTGSSNNPT